MMLHRVSYLKQLRMELTSRHQKLLDALDVEQYPDSFRVSVNGGQIRFAVDDFKAFLNVIRRLK